jgi:hypothetical protein
MIASAALAHPHRAARRSSRFALALTVRAAMFVSLALALSGARAAPASAATPGPVWTIDAVSQPTNFAPGSSGNLYAIRVMNTGSAVADGSSDPITVTDVLPPGLTATSIAGLTPGQSQSLSCALATMACTYSASVEVGQLLTIYVTVSVSNGAPTALTNLSSVSGGGAPSASTSAPTTISASPAGFGIQSFTASANSPDGSLTTQAGAHPYTATTTFALNTVSVGGAIEPTQNLKDATVELPPGFIGDPTAVPECPLAELSSLHNCPLGSQVGEATVYMASGAETSLGIPFVGGPSFFQEPVYNLVPHDGSPAAFAFALGAARSYLVGRLRSNGDYGIDVQTSDASDAVPILGVSVSLWGVPADPLHDAERGRFCQTGGGCENGNAPFSDPVKPFLTNPTLCAAPLATSFSVDSWQNPGAFASPPPAISPGPTGCDRLAFHPSISLSPDTTQADSPTALTVDLQVPQTDSPNTLATPQLKDATVTLPQGMAVSPSAADGLQGCSDAQVAPSSADPASCPAASQIGTVRVHTSLLDHPVSGGVYVGTPLCDPCSEADAVNGRMLRLFIAINDPKTGVVVKLPGTVSANPQTGQLTARFKNNPQLPFDDLQLQFKGGARAAVTTPSTCGTFTTTTDLSPWSAPFTPDATPSSSFEITGCASLGRFAPSFSAGTTNPEAGAFSPFTLTFSRSDEDQAFSAITVRTPPGLLGMLSKVPLCGEPQATQGTCPVGSQIGTTTVAAGAGSNPLWLPVAGRPANPVYLTGPYNGAPFGLSIVVPAIAGPFNLGNVVVRASIAVNPATAALTVTSGQLPVILDGIPLRVRTVSVTVDRPAFMLNPTRCDPMSVNGRITSAQGASAELSSRFQVGNCTGLSFHPRFSASTQGATSKANGASLVVRVATNQGPTADPASAAEANIKKVDVSLPLALPSRLTTLQKACGEAQFASNPAGCPTGSDVGTAVAHTPILPVPLEGPAYLVSHGGAAFPDLVIVLQGDGIVIDLTGNTQITKGVTYSRFETVPDAPISSFELRLPEGPYSALAANKNLCAPTKAVTVRKRISRRIHGRVVRTLKKVEMSVSEPLLMPTTITGQNGAVLHQTTKLAVTGCRSHAAKKKVKRRRTRGGPKR